LGKSASAVSTNNAKAAVEKRTWRIYTDESSGKKYYSDGVTTTWNRPAELGEDEPAKPNKRASIAEESAPKKKKKENSTSLYSSKAEAVAAFKGLLLAKDIAPHMKWNDVVKICSEDSRWEACSTIGERKQALAEYQTKRSNELKEVKRLEKGRAKEAFGRLLTDILSENWHELTSGGTCRFIDVRELLSKDDRFHSVEDEVTREELFYDFIEESRKREERTRRNKKREVKEGFLTLLRLYEERGKLSFASTWSSFVSQLDEKEKADPNFATGPNMSDSDRQLFFADFVIQLQMAEDEKHRRILEARQRAEKAQRDVYRNRLRSLAEEGYIRPNTRWNLVQEKIAQDASYPPVYAQNREAPRELFEDFVDEWNDEYRRERAVLNRALGMAKELKFDNKTGVEEFRKQILDASSPNPDLYAEVRRILTREDELSTCCLLYNERRDGIKNNGGSQTLKEDESSEDEGEIIEQT
jgi:pre-mRNA-processing factor 40